MIKNFIKYTLGYFKCKIKDLHVLASDKIYVGKGVHIVGGRHIQMGKNVIIRPYVDLWCSGEKLIIGKETEIGARSRISANNFVSIGNNVLISPNVYITDCDHEYRDITMPVANQGIVDYDNKVVICDNAYIGINAVIVGNVVVGKGSVIGANSVVTKDIPDYCVAVGSPARVLKQYDFKSASWKKV